jgi:hypothetical protein
MRIEIGDDVSFSELIRAALFAGSQFRRTSKHDRRRIIQFRGRG